MAYDPAIALGVKVPDLDISKPLLAVAGIQKTQAETNMLQFQQKVQQAKLDALQDYNKAASNFDDDGRLNAINKVAAIDPEAGKNLLSTYQGSKEMQARLAALKGDNGMLARAFPEAYQHVAQTAAITDTNTRDWRLSNLQVGGSLMEGWLAMPKEYKTAFNWNSILDEGVQKGAWGQQLADQLRDKPNDIIAGRMRATGMLAKDHMELTGGAVRPVEPTQAVIEPRAPVTGEGTTPPAAGARPHPTPQSKIEKEIPDSRANVAQPGGQGVLRPGQSPVVMKMQEEANERYSKDMLPQAENAQKMKGDLGSIIATLRSPNFTPDKLAGVRETFAGYIYAVTRSGQGEEAARDTAKRITGIDPAAGEVFNKSSVRLGFTMAREMGAREAAQVVQWAIGANPNAMQTRQGALKVAHILDQQANWYIDRAKYAGAWQHKNEDLVNFEPWWNNNHSLRSYVSKVSALPIESANPDDLEHGVTYTGQKRGGGDFTGRWNSQTQQFE